MRVANCVHASSAFAILCRLGLGARTTPTRATAVNGLRLRHLLRVRHLRGDRLRRTTGTTGAPLPARLATTAATVLRLLPGGDASEERLDRGADLLLHHVTDHRDQTLPSRHRPSLPPTPIRQCGNGSGGAIGEYQPEPVEGNRHARQGRTTAARASGGSCGRTAGILSEVRGG